MKRVRKDTRIHLVQELEALQGNPRNEYVDLIIKEAKAGEFHDYKNNRYPCGKVAVVEHLRQATVHASSEQAGMLMRLRQRVIDGEFDEEADEEDKAEMRKLLPKEAWPQFGL